MFSPQPTMDNEKHMNALQQQKIGGMSENKYLIRGVVALWLSGGIHHFQSYTDYYGANITFCCNYISLIHIEALY